MLLLVQGAESNSIPMKASPFVIGRRANSNLVLNNPYVSRDHAAIVQESGDFYLVDRGSAQGTYVNGKRVERHRLQPNDRIEFGVIGGRGICVIFNPARAESAAGREFLSQVVSMSVQARKSDLEVLALFLEAARKLNTSNLLKDVLLTLVETAIKLTHAERGYVFLCDDLGALDLAVAQDSKGVSLVDDGSISRSLLEAAATSSSEFLVHDTRKSSQLGNRQSIVVNELRSIICIPLRKTKVHQKDSRTSFLDHHQPAQTAGVLYLDSRVVTSDISTTSNDVLRAIASAAAALLENAHLVQAEEESRKLQQELSIASSIQQQLMTVSMPEVGFARVQARNIPCKDVGGDFFDVVMTHDGLGLVIADVCGKGIAAALLASILQGMIYSQLTTDVPLREIVVTINDFLCRKKLEAKYATLVLAQLKVDGSLEYVNCGHVPPLIVRQGELQRMSPMNLPVGLIPMASFESASFKLRTGDHFVLLTDGVTEAQNAAGELFGDERLGCLTSGKPPVECLLTHISEFCAGHPFDDDCTIVDLVYSK
jgi:serine phosphatase RsbU (regulator of sigma subunit)